MADQLQYISGMKIPKYLTEGFTITMWVRFMDKVNGGTLFNFGNPLRKNEPMGFMLETFVVEKGDQSAPSGTTEEKFYENLDSERFVRLVVREADGSLRDSHLGQSWFPRINTGRNQGTNGIEAQDDIPTKDNEFKDGLFAYTRIPIDFDEWYFIVASYDPTINEVDSYGAFFDEGGANEVEYDKDKDFWRGNVNITTNDFVSKSGYGARCKVEVISKSDLLRARGFKQNEE